MTTDSDGMYGIAFDEVFVFVCLPETGLRIAWPLGDGPKSRAVT